MNPLKSVNGTIILGFVTAVAIMFLVGGGDGLNARCFRRSLARGLGGIIEGGADWARGGRKFSISPGNNWLRIS